MEIYWQGHLTLTSFFTYFLNMVFKLYRSSHPDAFLEKVVLKICSNFKGEHPNRSAISIKLQSNFIEITLRHGSSPVNLLRIITIPFPKNTSGGLLLCHACLINSWRKISGKNYIEAYSGPCQAIEMGRFAKAVKNS